MATIKVLDSNGLLYFWQKITSKLSNKVDKVNGKGLSTNDYTSNEKTKLAGIAAGAEVNVNADWNASTGDAAILNKPTIPSKVSDLTNDSGFQTSSDVSSAITTALANYTSISYSLVQSLPATGEAGVIYLVANSHGTGDVYDEYIYFNNAFEKIGNTAVDMSGYVLSSDLVAITNSEIDTITSGS